MVLWSLFVLAGFGIGYEVVRIWILIALGRLIKKTWACTKGKVSKHRRISSSGKIHEKEDFEPKIPYAYSSMDVEYSVEGKECNTKNVNLWDFLSEYNYSSNVQKDIDAEVRETGSVTLWYNPDNPNLSVLRPEYGNRVWYEVGIGLIVVALLVPVYHYFSAAGQGVNIFDLINALLIGAFCGVLFGGLKIRKVIRLLQNGLVGDR